MAKKSLRVSITREGDHLVALGHEIDYMTQGSNLAELLARFVQCFNASVDENVKRFGTADAFLSNETPEDRYGTGSDPYVGTIVFEMDERNHLRAL